MPFGGRTRINHIVDRVVALDAAETASMLASVLANFEDRHRDLPATIEHRVGEIAATLRGYAPFTAQQRQLIGAYFLSEYAFEAAALCNPGIVAHPDQSLAPPGGLRFILSLRAVGEGHISSLAFNSGTVNANGTIVIDPPAGYAATGQIQQASQTRADDAVAVTFNTSTVGERILFPVTASQSNGIEDARFVRFVDGGKTTYYATYTAYDGRAIRSELLETQDFQSFRMTPLKGSAARNKGMALFPRRIGGRYAMIGRQDNENLFLLYSDDLLTWDGGKPLLGPQWPWEFVQMGNCGSPIELDEGWLLLTHGVGPFRRYAIGAALLDKVDPGKVLARSRVPLIEPDPEQRHGYVPNVVYTCGALRHGSRLVLPYAASDTFTNIAVVEIDAVLQSLEPVAA